MASLEVNPPRAALVDADGQITSEWYRFFVEVVRRLGGATNPIDDALILASDNVALNIEGALDGPSDFSVASNPEATFPAMFIEPGTLTAAAGLTGGGNMGSNVALAVGAGAGITVNADDVALDVAHVRNVDHTAITLTAGAGLTGGGDISASRTLDVGAGTGITVNANDVALTVVTAYGTYTPSLTNTANIDASTAYPCQYLRVGDIVNVSGRVDIDPTANATQTTLNMSLPIASALSASTGYQLCGAAAANKVQQAAAVYADDANDNAKLDFISTTTLNYAMFFTFQYQII